MSDSLNHRTTRAISTGKFYPLGATLRDDGVNFALYSEHASQVFLLLFDRPDGPPTDVIELKSCDRRIWHVFVGGLQAGQLYGFKVRGPYDPRRGLRFNEHKFLLDPYARALTGKVRDQNELLLAYDSSSPEKDFVLDSRDNTYVMPKCIVVDDAFDWQDESRPDIPFEKLVVYETHLKGFTSHPSSGVRSPGTYLGFVDKIPYLRELGVNAVELLPIHEFCVEGFLVEKGLTNYWGYNTVSFFAPELSYSTQSYAGCQVHECKTLVRELHKAGIEVLLDVVYNHTAEGSEVGPTLSLRGIDNPTYYMLTGGPNDPKRFYVNYTGCGNSLDLRHPQVIRFVMDSLRYWAEVMHVDGFRFDLASVLGRGDGGHFDSAASFFDTVSQDPILCRTKLIAEPWDLGTYQVGNFPIDWSEWNGRFRDTVRKFGKGDGGQVRDLGCRLTGSADLYSDDGRSAFNSVNFITCHDGFTLWDLLSYNTKHNEANLEKNRDGADDNNSWNCGVEGETDNPDINRLRWQIAKNHVCHLLFSLGTPMLLGGDEFLRTQKGNNNGYCQDNEISWFNWNRCRQNSDFVQFVRKAIAFRNRHTILRRRKFFLGQDANGNEVPDISWFGPDMHSPSWHDSDLKTLCCRFDGSEEESDAGDYLLFFILNADHNLAHVRLPVANHGKRWYRVIDTSLPSGLDFLDPGQEVAIDPTDQYLINPRSTVVLIGR